MIIDYINDDILENFKYGEVDAIIHGCNCFHTMGAGIAGAISESFPNALLADIEQTTRGDPSKLGTYSVARTIYGDIYNGYTQFKPGGEYPDDLYKNIEKLFTNLNNCLFLQDAVIGIPKIGSGIAGGDWKIIESIINKTTSNLKIYVFYI